MKRKEYDGGPAFPVMGDMHAHEVAAAAIIGITDPDERDAIYTHIKAQAVQGMSFRDCIALMIFVRRATDAENPSSYAQDAEHAFDAAEIFLRERDARQ